MTLSEAGATRPNQDIAASGSVSQPVLTLGEACIHAARHSLSMILTRWISGSMPTFGYFHAHYLFSAALILAMSSFVPIGNPNDMGGFDSALDILRSMTDNGNLAAAEFYHNLEQVKICLDGYRDARRPRADFPVGTANPPSASGPGSATGLSALASASVAGFPGTITAEMPLVPADNELLAGQTQTANDAESYTYTLPVRDTICGYTTEMAFLEPTMQDFLAQSDIDLGLLHPVDTLLNEAENLYTSHEL